MTDQNQNPETPTQVESVIDEDGDVILAEEDCCTVEEIEDAVAGFLVGDITLAQLEGITADEMYSIADTGYDLFEAGKLEEAKSIFEGLACYNPMDAYFHTVLGSIYQREANYEEAARQYRGAVELYPEDISAWTNLGETLLVWAGELQTNGEGEKASEAFEASIIALTQAIERSPEDDDCDSTLRARALASVATSAYEVRQAR